MTESNEQPTPFQVVVLSGPSGSGKSTIVDLLIAKSPVPLMKAISATTRPIRTTETAGEDYYFLTTEEFLTRKANNEFLETAEVHGAGYWYGTLRSELDRAREQGAWVFLEIDVQGALNVMSVYPDALTIFLETPSEAEFERRLRARQTETEEDIARRLRTAREELQFAEKYRYRVVNDDLQRAVQEICDIFEQHN